MSKKPTITVYIEGGVCTDVEVDEALGDYELVIKDYDNEPDLDEDYSEHMALEGDGMANEHPDGCFYCGSSNHKSTDCRERE